ncbi:hypothetical protein ACRYCC_39285 [Actinomadura scrupuli]|uniref:hypothetical protein n=1 Tax=Actinomadura scrupuli TaxID=559629 RepID=UPI003D95AC57
MRPRPRATAKIHLIGAAAALLLAAGCGGSPATAKQAATPGATPGPRSAFTDCLRKNGVTLPSGRPSGRPSERPSGRPSGGAGGFQRSMSPEQQKAFEACRSLMPGGGAFGRDSSAMRAFQACLGDHGVKLPAGRGQGPAGTPAPGATPAPGGGPGRGLRGLKTSDPKVAAALKICRPLLPTGAPAPAPS